MAEPLAGGTDRLVRLLGVAHLSLVGAGLRRHEVGAKALRDLDRAAATADSESAVLSVRMYVMYPRS